MSRPDILTRTMGRPLGCLLTFASGAFVVAAWLANPEQMPGLFAFLGALLCSAALKARKRRRAWLSWKGEWEEASGMDIALAKRRAAKIRRVALTLLSFAALASPFVWLATHPDQPHTDGFGLTVMLFLASATWWAVVGFARLTKAGFRGAKQRVAARKERPFVVAQALPVLRQSPGLAAICNALPGYCKALLTAPPAGPTLVVADGPPITHPVSREPRKRLTGVQKLKRIGLTVAVGGAVIAALPKVGAPPQAAKREAEKPKVASVKPNPPAVQQAREVAKAAPQPVRPAEKPKAAPRAAPATAPAPVEPPVSWNVPAAPEYTVIFPDDPRHPLNQPRAVPPVQRSN